MNELIKLESFEPVKSRFIELVDEKTFKKEASFAMQAINKNSQLAKATTASKISAVLNVAQIGLSLNPVKKEAYLVPRYNRDTGLECILEPSYQGLVKLLTDTGSVTSIAVYPVYKDDEFEVELGTAMNIIHKPKFQSKEIVKIYGIATLSNGANQIEIMTAEEVDAIRDKSESYKAFVAKKIKSCIWNDHYSEMSRKTLIRRFYKYLPKSDKHEFIQKAIALDESDYFPSDNKLDYAISLLRTSVYDPDQQSNLELKINNCTDAELNHIMIDLEGNQVDPIEAGMNYQQSDIKEKVS